MHATRSTAPPVAPVTQLPATDQEVRLAIVSIYHVANRVFRLCGWDFHCALKQMFMQCARDFLAGYHHMRPWTKTALPLLASVRALQHLVAAGLRTMYPDAAVVAESILSMRRVQTMILQNSTFCSQLVDFCFHPTYVIDDLEPLLLVVLVCIRGDYLKRVLLVLRNYIKDFCFPAWHTTACSLL